MQNDFAVKHLSIHDFLRIDRDMLPAFGNHKACGSLHSFFCKTFYGSLQHVGKLVIIKGLYQIMKRLHIKCLKDVLLQRRHKNDGCLPVFGAKFPSGLHSVLAWHLNIQQQNICRCIRQQ
jgi:hypothetical protein